MLPARCGKCASKRLHPGRQCVRNAASSCIWHAQPRIDVSGADSTIAGPVRIRYDITLDSITQDSTHLHIVPTETQPFSGKWSKSSSGEP